jgi:hypothetical protein
MKTLLFAMLTALLAWQLSAEVRSVPIPNEGWTLSFDAPPLTRNQDSKTADGYAYRANAGRFNLSFFVETPAAYSAKHKDVYEYYWPLASRNPLISKPTIRTSETPSFVSVQYEILAPFNGNGSSDERELLLCISRALDRCPHLGH